MRNETLSLGAIGSPVTFAGQIAGILRELYPVLEEPRYYRSGEAMKAALLNGEVDAIIGAHASSGGHTSFGDIVAKPDSSLYVIVEKAIPFRCCLLAQQGTRLEDIKVIYGGPASLPLATAFVAGNMPQARCETYASSTATVEQILTGDGSEAMLGTHSLAEQSGLALLAADIDGEEVSGNWWVISNKPLLSPEPKVLFVTARAGDDGKLGQLVNGLAEVGYRLSTIASRPTGTGLLEYDHLLRLHGAGHLTDVQAAIDTVAGARLAGAIGQR